LENDPLTPAPLRVRHRLARTTTLLPALLLVLLHAVALAVPLEPLHRPGIQDGGDYDSLIQPLVLALAGVSATGAAVVAPARPSGEPIRAPARDVIPPHPARLSQPRAPPLD